MVFYDVKILYSSSSILNLPDDKPGSPDYDQKPSFEILEDMNQKLKNDTLAEYIRMYAYMGCNSSMSLVIACYKECFSKRQIRNKIKSYLVEKYELPDCKIQAMEEITSERLLHLVRRSESIYGFGMNEGNLKFDLGLQDSSSWRFKIDETIVQCTKLSKMSALNRAGSIMADESLLDEIERIYSKDNKQQYCGHPVHYKISAGTTEVAKHIVDLLVAALYSNNRLLGCRINHISEISQECFNDKDLEKVIMQSQGVTSVIELSGSKEEHSNYASGYQDTVEFISKLTKQYQRYTLFIFVEIINNAGFTPSLMSLVKQDIDIVEIKEGAGDRQQALDFLNALIEQSEFGSIEDNIPEALPERPLYNISDVYQVYNLWVRNVLKNKVYKSYKLFNNEFVRTEKKKNSAYETLQKMVGLNEFKELVNQIISMNRIQKIREGVGLEVEKPALHMMFTGNPGSAKTTAARLLASILNKEGILESGTFVECGRSDLVGKYVGWTAKAVKAKFSQARGGILFIDEAYSLLDNSNSFGDEAINTIVQEMENNRDNVIVIFAGYPKKMKEFVESNEGLRSRLAYYLNFPDYSTDELTNILRNMVDEKGYHMEKNAVSKCYRIFSIASKQEGFGNGRFVRNLLEQAIMKQSLRVLKENQSKKITKEELVILKPSDFEVNLELTYRESNKKIGFSVA